MELSLQSLPSLAGKGYIVPSFDIPAMRERTQKTPRWIHFGAGNIFRAFPAVLVQRLIEAGRMDTGLIVAECYDEQIIDTGFVPFDNLTVAVSLKHDGSVDKRVVGSIAEALAYSRDLARLTEILTADSLQIVSMTITEKGYAVRDPEAETIVTARYDHRKAVQAALRPLSGGRGPHHNDESGQLLPQRRPAPGGYPGRGRKAGSAKAWSAGGLWTG